MHEAIKNSHDINLINSKSKRKKQIVNTAAKIFYETGYRGTTMRELAKSCGLTTGALYHYFNSKEDILHLIVKDFADHGLSLRNYYKKLGNIKIAEALRACIKKYYEIVSDDSDTILFFNREIRTFDKTDRDYLLKRQIDVVEFFESLLNKGIEKGEFRTDYPTLLIAHNILMLGQVYSTRRWFLRKRFTLEDYTEIQADMILKDVLRSNSHR